MERWLEWLILNLDEDVNRQGKITTLYKQNHLVDLNGQYVGWIFQISQQKTVAVKVWNPTDLIPQRLLQPVCYIQYKLVIVFIGGNGEWNKVCVKLDDSDGCDEVKCIIMKQ